MIERDELPSALDGLTRVQRIVLREIQKAERERGGRGVPAVMLYGRVVEHIDITEDELQAVLRTLATK